jgi:hypothetical protein
MPIFLSDGLAGSICNNVNQMAAGCDVRSMCVFSILSLIVFLFEGRGWGPRIRSGRAWEPISLDEMAFLCLHAYLPNLSTADGWVWE